MLGLLCREKHEDKNVLMFCPCEIQTNKLGVLVGLDMCFSFVQQFVYVSEHCSIPVGSLALLEKMCSGFVVGYG